MGKKKMYLEEEILRINNILRPLKEKNNIVIWGAGDNTVRLFQYTELILYSITKIVDKRKGGQDFFGGRISYPDEIDWTQIDAVVISSFYCEADIEKELIKEYHFHGSVIKLNSYGQEKPFYQHLSRQELQIDDEYKPFIEANRRYKSIHKGERLFVLCSGPSVAKMDLKPLKNEITIAVNGFYVHKDFEYINPRYYCAANATRDLGDEGGDFFYKELDKHLVNTIPFFCISDKKLIDNKEYFKGKTVNYYRMKTINEKLFEDIDLALSVMGIQSIPILCLQIALYMEFSEVYLIGTEHDHIVTGKYSHFYKTKGSYSQFDKSVNEEDKCITPFQENLIVINRLWNQYKAIKRIAEKKGMKIYNATKGGILDIFERVEYSSLF